MYIVVTCPMLAINRLVINFAIETAVEEWAKATSPFGYRKDEICLELSFPISQRDKRLPSDRSSLASPG